MLRRILLFVLLVTVAMPGAGRADSGFSPEGIKAIEGMMQQAVMERRITAAVAMLARDSEVVWLGTAGEMTPGMPMRGDAILPLASIGKMFTATVAMHLYERGVIALDEPVSNYIPEFANVRVQVSDEADQARLVAPDQAITIFHLLNHTGGLTVDGNEFWAAWDEHIAIQRVSGS